MPLSMYQACVPPLVRTLGNLSAILDKAAAHAAAKGIDPSVFVGARLAPDMYPLSAQVQLASDSAKGAAARLAGLDVPSFADTETTFGELRTRIARTLEFVSGVDAALIDGSEERPVTLKTRSGDRHFTGRDYLLRFVLPNVHFHVSMAYAILRHNGVDIGKLDYLGRD
jgi:uncharacterized protein